MNALMLGLYHIEEHDSVHKRILSPCCELLHLCQELLLIKLIVLPPSVSEEAALKLILAALQQLDVEFLNLDATPRLIVIPPAHKLGPTPLCAVRVNCGMLNPVRTSPS